MPRTAPSFYLYGEPHQSVEDSFVHIESLDDRSRPNEWTIAPHSHKELSHIFYISKGGGIIQADGERPVCQAPCLLLIPAGIVHGFAWEEETSGIVITIATHRLVDLNHWTKDTASLLSEPEVLSLSKEDAALVDRHAADLMRELSWARVGHEAAVQAALLSISVIALRGKRARVAKHGQDGRYNRLVARLRARIEDRFRLRESIASYAHALGTSETALRVACLRIAGMSPGTLIQQRALLEAKRALLFTDLSVSEIAYSLGFEDAAYFSRFFHRNMCMGPRAYRQAQRR